MTVQIGHLSKKSVLKDIHGNIINLRDDANGGWIVRNRQVVNPERFEEMRKLEQDKREAANAIHHQKVASPDVEQERVTPPSKIKELEDRISAQDTKLDAILAALSKKQ